jgi:hypothetical protein
VDTSCGRGVDGKRCAGISAYVAASMVAVDADWAAASLGPSDQTERFEGGLFGDVAKLFKRERPAVGRKQKVLVAPIFLPSEGPPDHLN